jgi:hypothetical protein
MRKRPVEEPRLRQLLEEDFGADLGRLAELLSAVVARPRPTAGGAPGGRPDAGEEAAVAAFRAARAQRQAVESGRAGPP